MAPKRKGSSPTEGKEKCHYMSVSSIITECHYPQGIELLMKAHPCLLCPLAGNLLPYLVKIWREARKQTRCSKDDRRQAGVAGSNGQKKGTLGGQIYARELLYSVSPALCLFCRMWHNLATPQLPSPQLQITSRAQHQGNSAFSCPSCWLFTVRQTTLSLRDHL